MNIRNASLLEKAALQWWRQHRPLAFSEEDHLENPQINVATDVEKTLALAVARALKTRGTGSLAKAKGLDTRSRK